MSKQCRRRINVESARISVATTPGGLRPPEIHQIKGQTDPKTRHSSSLHLTSLPERSLSALSQPYALSVPKSTPGHLRSLINSFGFQGSSLWFVLGPGGLPGDPENAHRRLWRAPRLPRARVKKPKNPYFLQGPIERPSLGF